jgi:regulatory protein
VPDSSSPAPPSRHPRRRHAEPPEPTPAIEIAVRYLGTRPRTRWEVDRRLRRAGVGAAEIDAVLERLTQLGYLDDAAFSRWWGEQRDRHGPRGHRMIEAELRQHGVPREVVEAYRQEHAAPERRAEDGGLPSSEAQRARDALDRHLRGRRMPADPKARQRIGMFLMRRGFDPDVVRAALREAGADAGDEVP